MQKVSIFISSPGDVGREREVTRNVIERLGAELGDAATLAPYFWEYEPVVLTKDYQEQIPPPSTFDIFICILWSRLGTRLHSHYTLPPDHLKVARSGTEFEFVDAALAVQQRGVPDILVWRNTSKPLADISAADRDERLRQWDQLEAFLDEWTRDQQEQVFRGALNEYKTLDEFEEKLAVKLRKVIQQRLDAKVEPRPRRTWEGNPFLGLHSFDFEQAPIFFGRTRAIGQVLEHLERQTHRGRSFVLVLGASGSGKSSLVRAGVLPLLVRPGTVEGIGLWKRAIMRPSEGGTDPFDALAAALLRGEALPRLVDRNLDAEKARESLAIKLRENPAAVVAWVVSALQAAEDSEHASHAEMLRHRIAELRAETRMDDVAALHQRLETLQPPNARLVLVVDQMEELFTTGVPLFLRQLFLKALRDLAASRRICVLATLRSDFYGKCEESPDLMWLKEGDGTYHLMPPTPAELGQMIREPARATGALYEETQDEGRLDERILQAALSHPESLPLLEHCLQELYAKCGAEGLLTHAEYEALGELEGVLASRAAKTLADCASDVQAALPEVLSRLVSSGAGDQQTPVRRVALLSEFNDRHAAASLVSAFVAARLFTTGKDAQDRPTLAITHEALFGRRASRLGEDAPLAETDAAAAPSATTTWRWREFGQWWEENRDFLRRRASLQEARRAWDASRHDQDYLLHGRALADAESLGALHALDSDDKTFITASQQFHRQQSRRARTRSALLVSSLVAALVVSAFGWIWLRQRAIAREHRLAAERDLGALLSKDIVNLVNETGRFDAAEKIATALKSYMDKVPLTGSSASEDLIVRLDLNEHTAVIFSNAADRSQAVQQSRAQLDMAEKLLALKPHDDEAQYRVCRALGGLTSQLIKDHEMPERERLLKRRNQLLERVGLNPRDARWLAQWGGLHNSFADLASRRLQLLHSNQAMEYEARVKAARKNARPDSKELDALLQIGEQYTQAIEALRPETEVLSKSLLTHRSKAIEYHRKARASEPSSNEYLPNLAWSLVALSDDLRSTADKLKSDGRVAERQAAIAEATDLARIYLTRLPFHDYANGLMANCLEAQARFDMENGRREDAVARTQEMVRIYEEMTERSQNHPSRVQVLVYAFDFLANQRLKMGDLSGANEALSRASQWKAALDKHPQFANKGDELLNLTKRLIEDRKNSQQKIDNMRAVQAASLAAMIFQGRSASEAIDAHLALYKREQWTNHLEQLTAFWMPKLLSADPVAVLQGVLKVFEAHDPSNNVNEPHTRPLWLGSGLLAAALQYADGAEQPAQELLWRCLRDLDTGTAFPTEPVPQMAKTLAGWETQAGRLDACAEVLQIWLAWSRRLLMESANSEEAATARAHVADALNESGATYFQKRLFAEARASYEAALDAIQPGLSSTIPSERPEQWLLVCTIQANLAEVLLIEKSAGEARKHLDAASTIVGNLSSLTPRLQGLEEVARFIGELQAKLPSPPKPAR